MMSVENTVNVPISKIASSALTELRAIGLALPGKRLPAVFLLYVIVSLLCEDSIYATAKGSESEMVMSDPRS